MENSIFERALKELSDLGLRCSLPIQCYNMGVRVYKPVSTPGNMIEGYSRLNGGNSRKATADEIIVENADVDAPCLIFYHNEETKQWIVQGVDGVGGMMPGDFVNTHATVAEAVADIRDYYFGDPARMAAKAVNYKRA